MTSPGLHGPMAPALSPGGGVAATTGGPDYSASAGSGGNTSTTITTTTHSTGCLKKMPDSEIRLLGAYRDYLLLAMILGTFI